MGSEVFTTVGWNGLFSIFVTLGCVLVAWYLIQEINFDKMVRNPRSPRARVLQLFLSIGLGYLVARFILDYWSWVGALKWLFNTE